MNSFCVLKDFTLCVIRIIGHELVAAVRADALATDPNKGGSYYALHVRRGDFQYKVYIYMYKYAFVPFVLSFCL